MQDYINFLILYASQIPKIPPIPLKIKELKEKAVSPHNNGMKPPIVPNTATKIQVILFEFIQKVYHLSIF
ncbi:MAG: hypothetical protein ACJAV6_000228 [Candidatus Paceibacteria bacterium]|jgi:hypothetical protein